MTPGDDAPEPRRAVGPAVDEAGRRLMLSTAHLHALAAVARGAEPDEALVPALLELRRADLVDEEGRLHPLVADLSRVAGSPLLRLVVEVTGPQGEALSEVVVSGEDVWVSEPWPGAGPDDPAVHVRRELPTLLWDLARLVGLHRATPPVGSAPLLADVRTVDAVLVALMSAPGRWEEAKAVLLASDAVTGLDRVTRVRWGTLLHALRSTWRITCTWGDEVADPASVGVRSLAVLDAGDEGLWRRTDPAEPLSREQVTGDTPVRLEPVSAAQVWRALADLLPPGRELDASVRLVAAAGRTAAP